MLFFKKEKKKLFIYSISITSVCTLVSFGGFTQSSRQSPVDAISYTQFSFNLQYAVIYNQIIVYFNNSGSVYIYFFPSNNVLFMFGRNRDSREIVPHIGHAVYENAFLKYCNKNTSVSAKVSVGTFTSSCPRLPHPGFLYAIALTIHHLILIQRHSIP